MKFGNIFADVITYAKFALRCYNFIILLIFKLFSTKRIITLNLAALLLMSVNFIEFENLLAIFAAYSK